MTLTRKTALITLVILKENQGDEIRFDIVIENDSILRDFINQCRTRGHVVIDWEVSFKSLDIINTFDDCVWDCLNKISNSYEIYRYQNLHNIADFVSAPVLTKTKTIK